MSDTVTEEKETAEEVVEEIVENVEEQDQQEPQEQEEKKEETVPVSAHVAERKKRQEAEQRVEILQQQMMHMQQPAQQQEPTVNKDDLLTVGQQQQTLEEWKRSILEEAFMEQNPELIERLKTELPEVLADPRHKWLADSITQAPNRLQRAVQILEMFRSKKQAAPPPNRQNTPKSPQSVAKTGKLASADKFMSMSDQELEEYRLSQKRKVR